MPSANPLAFLPTPGQAHDLAGAEGLLPQMAAPLLPFVDR
jgi:hypothetical protein